MTKKFFCSWSGGKDSALSLYKAIQKEGITPYKLLNIINENGERSRSHNLPVSVLKAQADALDIPLVTKKATWSTYEKNFIEALKEFKKEEVELGVFGDIDIKEHREWEEKVCQAAEMEAYLPLWNNDREKLLNEFIDLGFKTMIIVINEEYMDKKYLGNIVDRELIKEFKKIGIDPSGENGEYHTVVIDGPIFKNEISLNRLNKVKNDNYWFQNIELK